jgi:hypothetical protein
MPKPSTGKYDWWPVGPRQFMDRRMALKRDVGIVRYAVRAYRGVIVRRGADGKAEYDKCPHAHQKQGAARKCAEKEARRRNREARKATSPTEEKP